MNRIHCFGALMALTMSNSSLAADHDLRHDIALQALEHRVYNLEHTGRLEEREFTPEASRARFDQAMGSWMTGDHLLAAQQLQVLSYAIPKSDDLYPQVQWYLADSLHRAGMPAQAESSLLAIADSPEHLFQHDAIQRLLAWYAQEGAHQAFWDLTRKVTPTVLNADPHVGYILGRSQLILGAIDLAEQNLSRLSASGEHAIRSRYLLGTIALQRSDDFAAEALFLSCLALPADSERDAEVHDLAHLARARIEYVRGQYTTAAKHYSMLSPGSPHLGDALYEVTWTHLAAEDRAAALHSAQMLFLAFPTHPQRAKLELLVGHLHYTDKRWSQADQMFARIVDAQLPVRASVLEQLSDQERATGPALPSWAEERLIDNPQTARATTTSEDVASSLSSVRDGQATLSHLTTQLNEGRWPSIAAQRHAELSDTRRFFAHSFVMHLNASASSPRRSELRRAREAFALDVERDSSSVTRARVGALLEVHALSPSDERSAAFLNIAARMDRLKEAPPSNDPHAQKRLAHLLSVEEGRLRSLQVDLDNVQPVTLNLARQARALSLSDLSNELFMTLSEAEARRADIVWRALSDIKDRQTRLSMNHGQQLYELKAKYETVRSMIDSPDTRRLTGDERQ